MNQSQDLTRMGPKSWRTLQDDNKTISNILFIESIVANNFLEKNFEETAGKYFQRQIWDRYLKDWFRPQTMTKPFRIFS